MAIRKDFLDGVFERRNILGLHLVLQFAANAQPRHAMVVLNNLASYGLRIDRLEEMLVQAILHSGDWDVVSNRNISVHLSGAAQTNPLLVLEELLEGVTLDAEHDLKALQTGRKKTREEAYESIIRHWLTQSLRSTVRSWGLTIEHVLVEQPDGFHMVEITLRHDDAVVATYRLDGWSGMINTNGVWNRDRRPSPKSFEEQIEGDLVVYLERTTSTALTA